MQACYKLVSINFIVKNIIHADFECDAMARVREERDICCSKCINSLD